MMLSAYRSSSPSPSAVSVRRSPPPLSLSSRDFFSPDVLRKEKAFIGREKREKMKQKSDEGLEGLEALMARMLRSARLPASPDKELFACKNKKRMSKGFLGLSSSLSSSGLKTQHVVNRMRCRTVIQVYALLDPLNAGYIHPESACACISLIREENASLADLLLRILEDMLPLISSRGVLEKETFMDILYERIDSSFSGGEPYHRLRTASNPVSDAYKLGLACTKFTERNFYQNAFPPRGLEDVFKRLNAEKENQNVFDGFNEHSKKKSFVAGDLEEHIKMSAQRKKEKIEALKDELNKRHKDECTFKPQISSMPSFGSPFPSRRQFLGKNQEEVTKEGQKREGPYLNIQRQFVPVDSEVALPPFDADTSEEKEKTLKHEKEEKEKIVKGQEKDNKEESNKQRGEEETREEQRRKERIPELVNPTSFDVWVFHQGNPGVKPLQLQECLRVSDLPSVPLDGLSGDSPRGPPFSRMRRRHQGTGGGPPPPSLSLMTGEEDYEAGNNILKESGFPLSVFAAHSPTKHYHRAHPPLTPGLPSTFRTGFFRERIRESPEERRMRLGRGKSVSPPPAALTESVAEMKILKKKLFRDLPFGGGPDDPLLWNTNSNDFREGINRPPKRQPPFLSSTSQRREHAAA